jgi:hypothetical protein
MWLMSNSACVLRPLGYRIVAILEAFTAFFGALSAGIFIAHAIEGYRSRL